MSSQATQAATTTPIAAQNPKQKASAALIRIVDSVSMDVIIAGHGKSVQELAFPDRAVDYHTYGLNDIARWFTTDYLVVLDGPERFEPHHRIAAMDFVREVPRQTVFLNRARHVSCETRRGQPSWEDWPWPCETHLIDMEPCVPGKKINLFGKGCPTYQTSAFAAACLAFRNHPQRIGLIGIDILEDCPFSRHGFQKLDQMFGELRTVMALFGTQLVNLSPISALTTLPKVPLSCFHKKPGR